MPTKIEYTDETINPFRTKDRGWHCVKISPGCDRCYAEKINMRFGDKQRYLKRDVDYVFNLKAMEKFNNWTRKPRKIFWQDMSDIFLPEIALSPFCKCEQPCNEHDSMFKLLLRAIYHAKIPHINLFLTKRASVALEFYERNSYLWEHIDNLWLGTTAEDQKNFDKRWPYLKQIPATIKWISYEPALGPLVLPKDFLALGNRAWLVAGGESGSGARPIHPDWVRTPRDQCVEAGVPFFFKQWGEWEEWKDKPEGQIICNSKTKNILKFSLSTEDVFPPAVIYPHETVMQKVGKKAAGRLLDGKIWDQVP